MTTLEPERIHKVIARSGATSRRQAEKMIEAGRVQVDGKPAIVGMRVDASQIITIDGKPVVADQQKRFVILYHKPEGEICTRHDPAGRRTVFERFAKEPMNRLISIGRLDYNTSGLLLLTNDGELGHRLSHPSAEVEREYLCRIHGRVTPQVIKRLTAGVTLDNKPASFKSVEHFSSKKEDGINQWYKVVIGEGRYREVRRLWEQVGCEVTRLRRIRLGNLHLPKSLRPGDWSYLDGTQIDELHRVSQKLPVTPETSKPEN